MPQTRSTVNLRAKLQQHDNLKDLCTWPAESGSESVHVGLPPDKLTAFVRIMSEATSLVDKVTCTEVMCYLAQPQLKDVLQCVYHHKSGQQIMASWFMPGRDAYSESPKLLDQLLEACVFSQDYGATSILRREVEMVYENPPCGPVKERVRRLLASWARDSTHLLHLPG